MIKKIIKNKKIFYLLSASIFSFLVFMISIFLINSYSTKEVIIPGVKIKDGGIQKDSTLKKPVIYYNDENSMKKSDIKLKGNIKYNQNVKRYMKISGRVDLRNITFHPEQYRMVIIEVSQNNNSSFLMLPVDNKNNFDGYIYFKNKGLNKVSCYLFYDYLSNYGRKNMSFSKNTLASVGFFVNVLEEVPGNLVYLLPTKNVDCGNKNLRNLALKLTGNCTTGIEKAKKIYEYLVFGNADKNDKYKFKKYKDTYTVYKGNNFYNVYTASQILESEFGICNDFAEVYAAMMRALGFKIKKVYGYLDENKNEGHMWNIIDLTGDEKKWLRIDASWGNVNKINYKKWAEFYPEFDGSFFEESFKPYSHSAFSFERKVEY